MPFNESAYQRVTCTSDTPVIRMSQEQQKTVDLTLYAENGDVLNISELIGAPSGSSSSSPPGALSSSSGSLSGTVVRMKAVECRASTAAIFDIVGEIVSEETGAVRFELTPTETANAGIYLASVGVFHNDILLFQQAIYLEFMPTSFAEKLTGPLSVPEVRMDLMDMCPDANYLLDELEFTDAEIIAAMRKAVDAFNELPPFVLQYAYGRFPYRANWLNATSAYLLRMIAHRYRRNNLRYNAAGLSVDDQDKAGEYEQLAERRINEFLGWAKSVKVTQNLYNGFGTHSSPLRG